MSQGDQDVHSRVAQKLVDAVEERLSKMPFDKVKEKYANPDDSSEDIAKKLLEEGESTVSKHALEGREVREGVKGSGIEAGSDTARAQSAVDRLKQQGHVTPAADKAIKALAADIDQARGKARADLAAEAGSSEKDDKEKGAGAGTNSSSSGGPKAESTTSWYQRESSEGNHTGGGGVTIGADAESEIDKLARELEATRAKAEDLKDV